MNKFIEFHLLAFALILLFTSCNSKIENLESVQITSEPVFVTGNIVNPISEYKTVTVYVLDILSGDHLNNVSLVDSDGNFQIKFHLYYSQDVLVKYGDNLFSLFVHPEDSINVKFDANDISEKDKFAKNVQFSGDAADINSNLIVFYSEFYKIAIPYDKYKLYEKDYSPNEFIAILDSLRELNRNFADEFIRRHEISQELEKWIKNEIELDYYNKLANYTFNHSRYNNLDHRTVVPSSYYDFMNIEFPNEMLHNSHSTFFIGRYYFSRIRAFSKKFSSESLIGYLLDRSNTYFGSSTEQEIEVIKNITKDKFLAELLIARCLFNCLDRREIVEFEKHYQLFNKKVQKSFLKEPLINKYLKIKRHFENPEIGKNSLIKPTKDTPANELIKKIIEEHKGQIIYLDIWATWCSPCRNEMPFSKKLIHELDSNQVDFVYLCTDSKENRWKELISEMEIEGSHYLATPVQSRFIYELFEMSGVPHYVLIDNKGNIIDNGNHLRPSLNSTKSKILNLTNN